LVEKRKGEPGHARRPIALPAKVRRGPKQRRRRAGRGPGRPVRRKESCRGRRERKRAAGGGGERLAAATGRDFCCEITLKLVCWAGLVGLVVGY
jgi:hypothetical protein